MNYADMSAKKLLEVLNDLGEQDTLEAKSLHEDTSRSVLETVCSFSNEPGLGGGVILIGVAECKSADGPEYVVDGVEDADKAQLDLATQCKSVFNSAVFPEIKVEKIGRKKVLKVVVDELPAKRKPLYFKKDGLPKGAYRRIGSADLVATDDDLWMFYGNTEEKYDETPAKMAFVEDVDPEAVKKYRELRKKVDSDAVELGYKTPELMAALGCVNPENPRQLNMAGVLLFGKERLIARVCPLARVDYIRILGTRWQAAADQFDSVDTYAPIFTLVPKLKSIIYGELTTRHKFHRDSMQPDTEVFPQEVIREALVNALMHRDYRRGQYTQIIRYDNRIEIVNSGCSLKPDELLGLKGSVTRNDTIARVCHDTKLAETKGSGVDRMWQMMTAAGLSRPTMESDRLAETFTIRLLLHQFMDEGTLNWLKHFADYPLNADQRTALVFLREVGAVDALSYRQLTGCPAKRVTKDLAGLKESGLTIRKGRTSGTYYVPSEVLITTPHTQTTTPRAQTTTPRVQTTTASSVITTPPGAITTPLPKDLVDDLAKLKGKASSEVLSDLIVRLCSCRPMTLEMLQDCLKRGRVTTYNIVTKLIRKRIDYLYPMMVHHPNQAYVAISDGEQMRRNCPKDVQKLAEKSVSEARGDAETS